ALNLRSENGQGRARYLYFENLNLDAMTQPLTVVVLSTGLDNFKEIRTALSTDNRVQLLAGGNDAEQLHEEIMRLKPAAAIITLGANSDQAIKLIQRLSTESPKTALISAAHNAAPD